MTRRFTPQAALPFRNPAFEPSPLSRARRRSPARRPAPFPFQPLRNRNTGTQHPPAAFSSGSRKSRSAMMRRVGASRMNIDAFRQMVTKNPKGFLGRYGLGNKILQEGG